ncbi:type II secretion system F family protein [Streptomyces sp. NBC_00144]|uniref:type II secretion system F family protein n=1 Tax=Streptomyces sp. NBC_00144 TaxID=2975665 RepID=UPI0032456937
MTQSYLSVLGMVAGLFVTLGVFGAVAVLRGWRPAARAGSGALKRRGRRALEELPEGWRSNYRYVLGASAVLCVLMWAWTGWPIHGLMAGAALAGLPFVLYPGGSAKAQIARTEAVAEWLQQLASVHSAGKPLEQTIRELDTVPPPIRVEVAALAGRLSSGIPVRDAYRGFADDMGEWIGDDIALLFLDHIKTRGQGLSRILAAKAVSVARKASDLQDIDAERAKSRANVRRVSIFAIVVVGVILANPSYSAPFGSPVGQGGLLVLAALFAGALVWLRKMAHLRPEPRLLLSAGEREKEGVR